MLGVSGRAMLAALAQGESDPKALAQMARGRMRAKIPEFELALEGRMRNHHRIVLRELLEQVGSLDGSIATLDEEIGKAMAETDDPFESAARLLDTAPGVAAVGARAVVAEIGADMSRFPSAGRLASWAGTCPGNEESAGKRLSGRTTHGDVWLRTALIQMAQGAAKTKETHFGALYRRLSRRIGKKRAIVAVAHSLLVSFWHMLKEGAPYRELGAAHHDRTNKERTAKGLRARLESLGYQVHIQDAAAS